MADARQPETKQANDKIKLCVVCGHLAFARYPVLVGHYNGDSFAGTEARLDQALNGRLSERRRMGLYPGPIGSSTVVLDSNAKPPGAVVVGLGEPAGLAIGPLRRTLRRGIVAFAAAKVDQARSLPGGAAGLLLQVSALLIGAGEGGLDRSGCAQALLQAASEAQAILAELPSAGARLDAIEIIELFEDRALATWRAVDQALKADPGLKRSFNLAPDVKQPPGGRKNAPVGRDPSWWQPIQITMSGEAHERSLSFTVSGGLARAEARTIAANLDLVAPFVRRASRSAANDDSATSPGRTLFELLWPAALKDQSTDERHRRLILDERSASFPWELLDDRRPWMSEETEIGPPAVRAGMVRQLLQTRFREDVVAPRGKPKALIVGNPRATSNGLPDLPGATQETTAIAGLLKANDRYDVTPLIGPASGPEAICRLLFTNAWEIIHISAHGVLNQMLAGPNGAKRRVTGIALGGGVVLDPSALSKLPVSPGIIFVNCCHLGQIDLDGRPEFAANVAVELVKLGARCVIAAGWAVDDKVAAVFGKRFYEAMLNGATFGMATWEARKAAYDENPKGNTWGAYQCYGDPDYRLRAVPSGNRNLDGEPGFVAVSEAIEAARQVQDNLNIGLERDVDAQKTNLEKIEGAARARDWLRSAELRVALAEAWGELGDLPKAIEHYAAAVRSPDTSFKVKAIEQLANLSARNAVVSMRALPPKSRDPAKTAEEIRTWLRKLEGLTDLLGETRERLSLQGSCWKRLAQVQLAGSDSDAALKKMAECYGRAAAIEEAGDKSYPLLMACNARICDAVRTGRDCDDGVVEQLKRLSDSKPPEDADFWQLILWADVRMNDTILRSPDPSAALPGLEEAYRRAWRHVGSPVKLRSVVEQLDFCEDIFSSGDPTTSSKRESIVALARSLRDVLETDFLGKRPGEAAL